MMQSTAMPAEPSEVQPPGTESEKPTTTATLRAATQENSFLPPFLPSNEIEDKDAIRSTQVQSSGKLPEFETAEQTSWPSSRTPVLLLSSRGSDSGTMLAQNSSSRFSFDYQHANSPETYHRKTEQFMSTAKSQKASEVWIIHKTDATTDSQQPVIDGEILSENELYKPLYSRKDSKPIKLRVIYLLCPTESAEPRCSNTGQPVDASSSDEKWTPPKHASLCNSEFYGLVFDSDVDWQQVREEFVRAVASGKELTADELVRQIAKCYGARFYWKSGVPDANYTPPVIESTLNRLHSLQKQTSNECMETSTQPSSTNLFICIGVGKYMHIKDRTGFERDIEHYNKAAKQLGCPDENVYTLCPVDDYVTADQIRNFVKNVIREYKAKSVSTPWVFLAVSAHGNKSGILASDGKAVPVGELVPSLASLGDSFLLFYQACRGSRSHAAQAGENYLPAYACNLGFASPEVAGCVLPLQVPRAAAIFASMAGYEAYRNELHGSWMPRALLDVVSRPGTFTVRQLAEMVQARLHEHKKGGIVPSGKSGTAYIQTQYSANEGSENFVIQTGRLSSGTETAAADSETPEAGHSAAAEELAQLEINKPSQPD